MLPPAEDLPFAVIGQLYKNPLFGVLSFPEDTSELQATWVLHIPYSRHTYLHCITTHVFL